MQSPTKTPGPMPSFINREANLFEVEFNLVYDHTAPSKISAGDSGCLTDLSFKQGKNYHIPITIDRWSWIYRSRIDD